MSDLPNITLGMLCEDPTLVGLDFTASPQSPVGPISASPDRVRCTRAKTMQDIEDENEKMKSENFELKMRLYVLHEQIALFQNVENMEEVYQINSNLKKEIENLKAELADKEDLVVKAGSAMKLLEMKHTQEVTALKAKTELELHKLHEQIEMLQNEMYSKGQALVKPGEFDKSYDMYALAFPTDSRDNGDLAARREGEKLLADFKIARLEEELKRKMEVIDESDRIIDRLQEDLTESQKKLAEAESHLRSQTEKLNSTFQHLREREKLVVSLQQNNCSLQEALLSKETEIKTIEKRMGLKKCDSKDQLESGHLSQECTNCEALKQRNASLEATLKQKQMEYEGKAKELLKSITANQGLIKAHQALKKDCEDMAVILQKAKAMGEGSSESGDSTSLDHLLLEKDKIIDELRVDSDEKSALIESLQMELSDKPVLVAELETKKKEIDHLNEELRKRTFNLQELVNKELWDKNKEIEKLNKLSETKLLETSSLKKQLLQKESELLALSDKIEGLSEKIREDADLKDRLKEETEAKGNLKKECDELKLEAERSEKERKELMNVCVLLRTRLGELVTFLDSLLPMLGERKRKIVEEVLDKSRRLNQSLDISIMSKTLPILPDFSQVEFFTENDFEDAKPLKEIELLAEQLNADKPTFWADSVKFEDRFDLNKLANLASSFNLDDMSEGSFTNSMTDSTASLHPLKEPTPHPIETQSESEGWSEPDRSVSMARIGIKETVTVAPPSTDDSSENSLGKKRSEAAEIRRLSLKVRGLEKIIQDLKCRRDEDSGSLVDYSNKDVFDRLNEEKSKLEKSLQLNKEILQEFQGTFAGKIAKGSMEDLLHGIAGQLESLCRLCATVEHRCSALEAEKVELAKSLVKSNAEAEDCTAEVERLKSELKEKENEILEKQCMVLELTNNYMVLDSKAKSLENTVSELTQQLNNCNREHEATKKSSSSEIVSLKNRIQKTKEEHEKTVHDLQLCLESAVKTIEDKNLQYSYLEKEYKQKMDLLEREKSSEVEKEALKRMEIERKLCDCYEKQAELHKKLEFEVSKNRDIEMAQKTSERWWRRRAEEADESRASREQDLRRRLDSATLATSQAVLERTRLANDKIRLQCELRRREEAGHEVRVELEQRVLELEEANKELEKKLSLLRVPTSLSDPESPKHLSRQRSNVTSDYTSDPDQRGSNSNLWFPVCGRSNNNSSPDLGIESDHGRLSSLDPIPCPKSHGDVHKLERENAELRSQVQGMRKDLEETLNQLRVANQKKRQVERAICRQLNKTHDILQRARLNLEPTEQTNI